MSDRTTPLSVMLVDPINYSGMAYYSADLAGGLAAAGVDVVLAGSDHPMVRPQPQSRLRFDSPYKGTDPERPRWRRALAYPGATLRVIGRLRRERPDWLLWNYIEQPAFDRLAINRARSLGSRLAFIAHEAEPWDDSGARREIHRWLVEGIADAIIVHGERNASLLRQAWQVDPERIVVGEHGDYRAWVDHPVDQDAAREHLGVMSDAPLALFFGNLRMSKGLVTLLAAWPSVRRSVPDAQLIVAGRPYRDTDLATLKQLGAGITLHARAIPADQANAYYAACDVVTIPYEKVSTSGVLRYAYSSGRPVVATDTGELSLHVRPGETGWLVAPGDPEATARALIEALSDRARTHRLGAAARTYSDRVFDWRVISASLVERLRMLSVGQDA